MGGESWHAIKKLFNPPFLILKVRHPAVTGVYCIVRDSRSGCSNDFKCTGQEKGMREMLMYAKYTVCRAVCRHTSPKRF